MTYRARVIDSACLLMLLASGCLVREPGTSVEVSALSSAASVPRSSLTSDQGYHVQLSQLYIVLSKVELIACPGEQRVSILRELFGPSIAYAHGTNTATAWSVPNVLAPLADNAPVSIAVLHPPAITYCGLRVSLEAADKDAERMPPGVDMSGLSMLVRGSYALNDDGRPGIAFSYQSFVASTMELPLLDAAGNPRVVTLSKESLNFRLQIEISYQRLFDGLYLFPGAFGNFGDVVVGQILSHATTVVVDEAS